MSVIKELIRDRKNPLDAASYLVPTTRFELLSGARRSDRIIYQIEEGIEYLKGRQGTEEVIKTLETEYHQRVLK